MKLLHPGHLHRLLIQSTAITILSSVGLVTGWVPNLTAPSLTASFSTTARAGNPTFTNQEITSYAQAAIALESRRHQAVEEIKRIVGQVPRILCDEPTSINMLPGNAPQIAVSYCDQAKRIIESKGLTVSRFNEITRHQQSDSRFRERIQAEILRIMQSPDGR
ncbi:DUF4168 domain-containing protein [Limnospira fusiformis KN01]|uniref:DUF4168 domain-containing protein n=1 Tax=Limnospira fusiformis PMC 851.14 TaxID=2219512 RepID=A0ABU9EF40_LIMFS|nr:MULTISPECIES: DUF4168 domain-containing protein [Limnospira]EKD07131.1 hypothetical protein SPLC1_S501070 [Arthrospira platensis C1]MDT9187549.1 DUF4168 domain-containing protein [Limnospira sp. PMC 894.15]MDT9198509.1 DUF4168 domain-containing protein [Limnospira sp. PMC 1042.18]MDT9273464.1 DUF4168 domain-containing protein [Limnospira sp. PMC 737.11]ULB47407.1 DUF4168 domain-containing protein [Limnospira fusiformis KN01]